MRVTVKASGDFTRALSTDLKTGMQAVVEGAHGMFDYRTGREETGLDRGRDRSDAVPVLYPRHGRPRQGR
ncbi:MAG: hypothetical protein MZV64_00245 [Ignavibacteriales bacterium]|nr:hypothetical protein [Ignavibacteriales bacterium]